MSTLANRLLRLLCSVMVVAAVEVVVQPSATRGAAQGTSNRELVVGRVVTMAREEYPKFKRLADYLAARMRDLGITGSRIEFAKDNDVMMALLRQGRVDVVPETVFSALIYAEEAGAELLLREWRYGSPTYQSLLVARKNSGINELADLRGKRVAFEDAGSTSAYFVPRAELLAAGVEVIELPGLTQPPPPEAVGYVFAGEEINIVTWVNQGRVDAGALSSEDWDTSRKIPSALKEDLVVFHSSAALPRSVVVVRGDLPREMKERIKRVLLAAHEDPEGRTALEGYKRIGRYDELTGEAATGVEEARRMLEAFR